MLLLANLSRQSTFIDLFLQYAFYQAKQTAREGRRQYQSAAPSVIGYFHHTPGE
jgi:hypothetical protein